MTGTFNNIPEEKQIKVTTEAMKLFAEYGYEVASTNLLTQRLAISKGSLFKYFNSKLGLYEYLVLHASTKLTTYINQNIEHKFKTWHKMIINYASVEYDFLIQHPIEFNFLRSAVREMDLPALVSVQSLLIAFSKSFSKNVFNKYGLSQRETEHINFVIQGYKSHFMKMNEVKPDKKNDYINGLEIHLDMIKIGGAHDYKHD